MKRVKINQLVRSALLTTLGTTMLFSAPSVLATNITGAGASFPAPIYAKWAADYKEATGVEVNYQSVGSSAGRRQITARTVDFGASDAPVKDVDLEKDGLFQFPTVIGGVVLAVNLPNLESGQLVLDGKTVADIYLGKIKKWNDPAIQKLNPTLNLPKTDIAVIRRADGSGTTFVFTSYLSKVSDEWRNSIGAGNSVQWAAGTFGGRGNEGVSGFVQQIEGAIGYVEYAYAKQNNLPYSSLVSAHGEIVRPSGESFSNAAAGADWKASFAQDITNQATPNAWPISSATFILVEKSPKDVAKTQSALKFFEWAFENGGAQAEALDYAKLPAEVVETIKASWKTNILDKEGKPVY